MIRINLLGVERQKAKAAFSFDISKHAPAVCAAIVLLAAAGGGSWFWSLRQESLQVDAARAKADREVERLKSVMAEVAKFEERTKQLEERVKLIETLRDGQSAPVQVLDHISRSLPDMMWLTDLKQDGAQVTLKGHSTTLIALSDFVGNLGKNPILKKPIEIVDSQVETSKDAKGGQSMPDLIAFTVRAQVVGGPPVEEDPKKKKKGRA